MSFNYILIKRPSFGSKGELNDPMIVKGLWHITIQVDHLHVI